MLVSHHPPQKTPSTSSNDAGKTSPPISEFDCPLWYDTKHFESIAKECFSEYIKKKMKHSFLYHVFKDFLKLEDLFDDKNFEDKFDNDTTLALDKLFENNLKFLIVAISLELYEKVQNKPKNKIYKNDFDSNPKPKLGYYFKVIIEVLKTLMEASRNEEGMPKNTLKRRKTIACYNHHISKLNSLLKPEDIDTIETKILNLFVVKVLHITNKKIFDKPYKKETFFASLKNSYEVAKFWIDNNENESLKNEMKNDNDKFIFYASFVHHFYLDITHFRENLLYYHFGSIASETSSLFNKSSEAKKNSEQFQTILKFFNEIFDGNNTEDKINISIYPSISVGNQVLSFALYLTSYLCLLYSMNSYFLNTNTTTSPENSFFSLDNPTIKIVLPPLFSFALAFLHERYLLHPSKPTYNKKHTNVTRAPTFLLNILGRGGEKEKEAMKDGFKNFNTNFKDNPKVFNDKIKETINYLNNNSSVDSSLNLSLKKFSSYFIPYLLLPYLGLKIELPNLEHPIEKMIKKIKDRYNMSDKLKKDEYWNSCVDNLKKLDKNFLSKINTLFDSKTDTYRNLIDVLNTKNPNRPYNIFWRLKQHTDILIPRQIAAEFSWTDSDNDARYCLSRVCFNMVFLIFQHKDKIEKDSATFTQFRLDDKQTINQLKLKLDLKDSCMEETLLQSCEKILDRLDSNIPFKNNEINDYIKKILSSLTSKSGFPSAIETLSNNLRSSLKSTLNKQDTLTHTIDVIDFVTTTGREKTIYKEWLDTAKNENPEEIFSLIKDLIHKTKNNYNILYKDKDKTIIDEATFKEYYTFAQYLDELQETYPLFEKDKLTEIINFVVKPKDIKIYLDTVQNGNHREIFSLIKKLKKIIDDDIRLFKYKELLDELPELLNYFKKILSKNIEKHYGEIQKIKNQYLSTDGDTFKEFDRMFPNDIKNADLEKPKTMLENLVQYLEKPRDYQDRDHRDIYDWDWFNQESTYFLTLMASLFTMNQQLMTSISFNKFPCPVAKINDKNLRQIPYNFFASIFGLKKWEPQYKLGFNETTIASVGVHRLSREPLLLTCAWWKEKIGEICSNQKRNQQFAALSKEFQTTDEEYLEIKENTVNYNRNQHDNTEKKYIRLARLQGNSSFRPTNSQIDGFSRTCAVATQAIETSFYIWQLIRFNFHISPVKYTIKNRLGLLYQFLIQNPFSTPDKYISQPNEPPKKFYSLKEYHTQHPSPTTRNSCSQNPPKSWEKIIFWALAHPRSPFSAENDPKQRRAANTLLSYPSLDNIKPGIKNAI